MKRTKGFLSRAGMTLGRVEKRAGMMMLAMMLTTVTAGAWDGKGTSEEPFQIKDASDLAELATGVNGGNRYTNIYFVQTGDITASGSMETIGTSNPFCGHYDGGGFTISGLTQPLFGSIQKGQTGATTYTLSEVKNLTISGAGISTIVTGGTTGILAKSVYNKVSVTNCHVVSSSLAITGGSNAKCGGLIGSVEDDWSSQPLATVSGCSVTATTITNDISGQYCGGLFGYLTSRKNVYDNYVEATLSADNKGGIAGYLSSTATPTDYHDNYYHAATGLTAIASQTDNGEAAVCALSGVPSGVTVSPAALLTRNTKSYYAVGNVVLTVDNASKAFLSFSVSGATYSVAANKKSATVTLATSDATVSAELLTISGSCGDNATWTMSDTNSDGTYEKLTISGTGRIAPYENGTAPWYADFHSTITNLVIDNGIEMIQESDFYGLTAITEVTLPASVYYIAQNAFEGCSSLARVNIKKTDGVVTLFSSNAFNGCHSSLVIVVPTPALALQYIDNEDWTAYASKLRANLGGYAFRIDGTTAADAAYQIADADDLRRLANAVNAGNGTATSGKSFRQTADIDLGGTNFPIIGDTFRGTYDGQGFAISGLSVSTNRSTVGLFGYIDGATLRGITLVQPSVTTSSPNNNLTCDVGAIVGYAYKSTIENCHALQPTVSATGTGSGAKRIGAIAGETDNSSRLTNCCYYGGNAAQAMGYGNATLTRVGRARKVTLGSGIASVSPALTVGSGSNGFRYDGTDYYREGLELTVTPAAELTAAAANLPEGYDLKVWAKAHAPAAPPPTPSAAPTATPPSPPPSAAPARPSA